jgi:hypothetical protein
MADVVWTRKSRVDEITARVLFETVAARQEALETIFEDSQARVPVAADDSRLPAGSLKDSGRIEGESVMYGGGDVDYAPDVEYGTRFTPAQPFLTPAIEKERAVFGTRISERLRGAMRA